MLENKSSRYKRKVATLTKGCYIHKDEWYGIYKCTHCGKISIWHDFNYCPNCGKKIEWVGEDDDNVQYRVPKVR